MIDRKTAIAAIKEMAAFWDDRATADLGFHTSEIIAALSPQWQDIATAPKDGTRILILTDRGMIEAKWHNGWDEGSCYNSPPEGAWAWCFGVREGQWVCVNLRVHGCECSSAPGDVVTHWMPLPEAPAQ
jgi:hypothetical protein